MPLYHFNLTNSTGPTGAVDAREFMSDDDALREGATAAGEVLLTELAEGQLTPHAMVTIDRDGTPFAVIRTTATVERLS